MPATMEYWKTPMLDLLANPTAVEGKDKSLATADQQGESIGKPAVRLDFGFDEFVESPVSGNKSAGSSGSHNGSFVGAIAGGKVTDGMTKAGY